MSRASMLSSVQDLADVDEPVDEVVVVLSRPPWSLPVSIVAFIAVWFVIEPLDLGAIIRGALAGAVLGLVMAVTSTRWMLAGTPTNTLLVRSKPWTASASSLEARYPRGVEMTKVRSFINSTYALDGRSVVVPRAALDRLGTIATLR